MGPQARAGPAVSAASRDLKGYFKGDIDIDIDVQVDVDVDRYFGCLSRVSKSGESLLNGTEQSALGGC